MFDGQLSGDDTRFSVSRVIGTVLMSSRSYATESPKSVTTGRPQEIRAIYDTPLLDLVYRAAGVHRRLPRPGRGAGLQADLHQDRRLPGRLRVLLAIVALSDRSEASPLMDKDEVLEIARRAKAAGVSRVCMGAAWREVRDNKQFDRVLDMVKDVTALGVEVCCTLGMLDRRPGAEARRRRPVRLQPQPRHLRATITKRSSPPAPSPTA